MKKNNLNRYINLLKQHFALGGVLGPALKMLAPQLSSMVAGDGSNAGQNLLSSALNPIGNTMAELQQGNFLEALPVAGSFIKATKMEAAQRKAAQQEFENNNRANIERSKSILAGYPTQGVKSAQLFGKYGMKLKYANGGIMAEEGGQIMPISSTGSAVLGRKHSQGGVQVNANGVPAELEGGEGVHTLQNGEQLVSSDSIPSPNPDEFGQMQSMAAEMQKLEAEKAHFEKILEKRPDDAITKNVIKMIDDKIMKLAQQQEAMMGRDIPQETPASNLDELANEQQAAPQEYGGQMEMKYGGRLKYLDGGPTPLSASLLKLGQGLFGQTKKVGPQDIPALNTTSMNAGKFGPTSAINDLVANYTGNNTAKTPTGIVPLQNNMTVPSDNTGNVNNFGLRFGSLNLGNASPYLDNITNVMLNAKRSGMTVPRQALETYINPRLVNYDDQRAEATRQQRGLNQNIMFNNSNSATANANLVAGLTQSIRARNEINRNEANTNQGILSQTDLVNNQILGRNNATTYRDDIENFKFRESLLGKASENVADLSKDMQVQQRDAKAEEMMAQQQKMQFMVLDEERQIAMYEQYPELIEKIAPEWAMAYKNKLKSVKATDGASTIKTMKPLSIPVKTNFGGPKLMPLNPKP